MAEYYGLNGSKVSYEEWLEIFHSKDKFLARDVLDKTSPWGAIEVSTVWIGLSWLDEDPPLVFETMVFPLEDDASRWSELGCWRWATFDAAHEGHQAIIDGIRSGEVELRDYDII
jgi:hypothetical protein